MTNYIINFIFYNSTGAITRREYAVAKRHGYRAIERWERNAVSLIEYANFIAQGGGRRTSPFLRFFAYAGGLHPIPRGK